MTIYTVRRLNEIADKNSNVRILITGNTRQAQKALQELDGATVKTAKGLDDLNKVGSAGLKTLIGALGATAVAGIGTAGALGGMSVAMLGVAAIAQSSNAEVASAYKDLWTEIKSGTQSMTESTVPHLIDSAETLRQTFRDISPDLAEMFSASAPSIGILTDGISGLIKNSMPGLKTAVLSSGPVFEGLNTLLKESGTGLSNFFEAISSGAPASGSILASLGKILNSALTGAGGLISKLANEGAPAFDRFADVVGQVMTVVNQLATGALPIMFSAIGTGLNILSGFVSLLGGAQSVVGPLIGTVLSAAAAFKLMDAVTFGGLTGQLTKVKTSIGEATTTGGKLKAGILGMLSGFGPVALAAGAFGVVLSLLGQKQQEAAQKAQEHKTRVQSLADALKESKGVIDDSVRAFAAKTLAETKVAHSGKNVVQTAKELGISIQDVTNAFLGDEQALQRVNAALYELDQTQNQVITTDQGAVDLTTEKSRQAHDLKNTLSSLNTTHRDAIQLNRDMAEAQRENSDATRMNKQALIELQDQMLASTDKNMALRQATLDRTKAEQEFNKVMKDKKATTEEQEQASLRYEQAQLREVLATNEQTKAMHANKSASEQSALAYDAQAAKIIELAKASNGNGTPAIRQMIASMSNAQLTANGATREVDALGNTIIRLPGGKVITLNANDLASAKAMGVENQLNRIPSVIWTTINLRLNDSSLRDLYNITGGFSAGRRAGGGPVEARQPYWVGEEGPELIFPDRAGYVATAQESARMTSGLKGMSAPSSSSNQTVVNVTVQGTFLGVSGVAEVAKIIDQEIKKNNRRNGH